MRADFYEEYKRIEREHWWFIGRRRIILSVLASVVGPHLFPRGDRASVRTARVLDIGLGSGVMLGYLEAFADVVGCDIEWAALLGAKSGWGDEEDTGAGKRLVQADARRLPFRPESFDLVTMFDLLEHVVEDTSVLGEVFCVLRPGGFVCMTVPMHPWLWGNQDLISGHVRRYRPGEVERKMKAVGFTILYRSYFNTILFPVVVLVRLFFRRFHRGHRYPAVETAPESATGIVSDFSMTKPGRLNDFLAWVFSQEARWLRRWRFPVGVSFLCVGRRTKSPP